MFNFSSLFTLLYCTDAAEQGSISKWRKVPLRSARRGYFCMCTGSHAYAGFWHHAMLVPEHSPSWSKLTAGQFRWPGMAKVPFPHPSVAPVPGHIAGVAQRPCCPPCLAPAPARAAPHLSSLQLMVPGWQLLAI